MKLVCPNCDSTLISTMKRRLLLTALVISFVAIVWLIGSSPTQAPLAARVLYRTNSLKGQSWVLSVTNLIATPVLVETEGLFYSTGLPVSSGIPAGARLRSFELHGHTELVVDWLPGEGRPWTAKLLFWPRTGWSERIFRIRQAIHLSSKGPYYYSRTPQTLLIDIPHD